MNSFRSAILKGKSALPANPLVSEKRATDGGDDLSAIGISRDAQRSVNHRDSDRHRLDHETAAIVFKRKTLDAELINISGGGAMIRADIKPRLWDRVDLILGEGSAIECAVRWLRDDRIGLEFAHETRIECDPEQRDALLREVIRRSFPDAAPALREQAANGHAEPKAAEKSRRGDQRHPLIWNGHVLWRHDSHKVRLRNISESGVLIDCHVELPAGTELMLDLGDSGQFFATVSWSRSGQAGMVFRDKFNLAVLAAARPAIAQKKWDRPGFLDLSANQASPWASEWDRSSLEELREDLEGFMKR